MPAYKYIAEKRSERQALTAERVREALDYMDGAFPSLDVVVDHWDMDGLNNRWCNFEAGDEIAECGESEENERPFEQI